MTYSLIGRDASTGAVGGAVESKFPGVATIVLHGDSQSGIILTQAMGNPDHGRDGLELLRLGASPSETIAILTREDADEGQRQIAAMNLGGDHASHTGRHVPGWQGESGALSGDDCIVIGNSLANAHILPAMVAAFQNTTGDLATRLIAGLAAGRDAGGDLRGQQAAGVLVVKSGSGYGGRSGRMVDISVYDHPEPIDELARCYELHRLSYFPSEPENLMPVEGETASFLREVMAREGIGRAGRSGEWDETDIAALARFMGQENYDNRIRDDALIDREVLADIRMRHG